MQLLILRVFFSQLTGKTNKKKIKIKRDGMME
jgi:hypothetical protein